MYMRLSLLVLLAMAGCVSDSGKPEILPNMVKDVARVAVRDAMMNPTLRRYVESFRAGHNGMNPVVKVGWIRSDVPLADAETLKESLVRPFLADLASADFVEVSSSEGLLRTRPTNDAVTEIVVCRNESPRAADIVLTLNVKFREEKRDDSVANIFLFELSMADISRGKIIWKNTKQYGVESRR